MLEFDNHQFEKVNITDSRKLIPRNLTKSKCLNRENGKIGAKSKNVREKYKRLHY